jgi:acyl-coenzyme A thioesterase PaaI-like protein
MNMINDVTLEGLNKRCENTMSSYIGIEFTKLGEDYLVARMPWTTVQGSPLEC